MASCDPPKDDLKARVCNGLMTPTEAYTIVENILKPTNERGPLKSYYILSEPRILGYMGDYYRMHIKYQKDNQVDILEKDLFVKSTTYNNSQMAEFIDNQGFVRKESTIYLHLVKELKTFSPKVWCGSCYHKRPDLLVIDDITAMGYEPLKEGRRWLNKPELKCVLRGLATMHACSLAAEHKNKVNIGEQFVDVLFESVMANNIPWFTAGVKAVLSVAKRNPLYQTEPLQLFISNEMPGQINTVYEMTNTSKKYRNVFCHRDVLYNNVFFHKTNPYEKGVVFVDFQCSRYSPPALDVLMAVYLNVRPNQRGFFAQECFDFYYESLSSELRDMSLKAEDFLTYTEYTQTLKEFELFAIVYNCVAATIYTLPKNFLIDMKLERPDDFYRYIYYDRTNTVLSLMKTNKDFESQMSECVYDLMKALLKGRDLEV